MPNDDFTNLNNWQESQAEGSFKGPICPDCGKLLHQKQLGPLGLGSCDHCGEIFHWSMGSFHGRPAWQTWRRSNVPRPEGPEETTNGQ